MVSYISHVFHTVEPYDIPRFAPPTDWDDVEAEPDTGACWNCDHVAEVYVGGKTYYLCVKERDNGKRGDVEEIDYGIRHCEDWDAC